jgi:hypothetical protein
MGFPVVSVDIVNDSNPIQVKVTQKRFLLNEDKTAQDNVTYRY